ncbi:zinc finger protein 438 isoform X2 [Phyllopteryx taeniolatus]|uniref:zinc finger protein 438 isoform X2 n=1 Tax=Phyllopteryx taeniolatus TaxID=161469 RepID=UPI002AD51D0E|nr:zinc finger protein 438 isoform X2 [Phyllopteryx taeniolatus]XP_061614637.1 zinc finger protein 438 isoform X2 [Phyllopteryx taeniolatus]
MTKELINWFPVNPAIQMKSLQFRSIAPKAPVIVPCPSSAVLSCQPPTALLEANSGSSPKSIVVPTQNYALMQIAGQDGTFSLVALPPSVSSQTTQRQQSPQTQSIQKNLKLPIPRYKPVRKAGTTDKVGSPPISLRVKTASGVAVTPQTKTLVSSRSALIKKKREPCAVTQKSKEEVSEQVIFIDPAHSEISVPALLPDNAVLYPGSRLEQTSDKAEQSATTGVTQNPSPPSTLPTDLKTSPGKSKEQSGTKIRICQSKPASAQPPNSITVISPAIFGKAVQIIPSPPKGKLPILPYSKMKTNLIPAAKLNLSQDKDCLSQSGPMSPKDLTSSIHEKSEALGCSQMPNSSHQPQNKNALIPVLGNLQKLPGKKRGRKRKTMEDILAYEARKKRSLSFFRRRVPEKPIVISGSKQKEVDISKKYRSIQPKPVLVIEALPHLLSLPASTSDGQEPDHVLSHQLPTSTATQDLDCSPQHPPVTLHLSCTSHSRIPGASRSVHRCPTCSRCFQFKHRLQSHMNIHTNSRPYVCPVCRKAYAHSGSLSTHMKLHHSEAPSRRSLCCEFCEKAFGYVGVYFRHLREVHKVLLTVEPSIRHHEEDVTVEWDKSEASDELDPEESVELQIKCGRCQVVTLNFADMKMHLLYVHGEEVLIQPRGNQPMPGGLKAEKELVKHAAHYWRQLNKKRNLVKCGNCDEEFFSFAKLKRHMMFHHCGSEGEDSKTVTTSAAVGCLGVLAAGSAFNCVLCSKVLDTKEGVLEHWRGHHHCKQPSLLWAALSTYSGLEDDEANRDLDTPVPSPH